MAIRAANTEHKKHLTLSVLLMVMVGWLLLVGWAMSQWLYRGFDYSYQTITYLAQQQSAVITPFIDASPIMTTLIPIVIQQPTKHLHQQLTRINQTIRQQFNTLRPAPNNTLAEVSTDALQKLHQLWQLISASGRVMLIKLAILITAIPLFLLTMGAGLVDGLNQRAIRTASLGRESSYVFHQLHRFFKRSLLGLLALWFAIPIAITPTLIVIPVSILLSLLMSITTSRFKKYW